MHDPASTTQTDSLLAETVPAEQVLVWQRRYARAKQAREQAEQLLQEKSRALYLANQELQAHANKLQASLEQLEAAQDALVEREKMAALGAMVAGIAHEVNTPLGVAVTGATLAQELMTAVLGRLEQGTLTRGDLRREMAALQEATGLVVTNAQRAATLIQSFKKVAVDQSSEALRKVRLADLLADVLTSLQPVLRRARVTASLSVGADRLLKLDAGALAQIVTNLVQNACVHAFLPEHDQRTVAIEAEVADSEIRLCVRDNGRGMSAEVQQSVFEPFFTTRRDSGGSGLGMHIVRNLVVGKFAGSIEIASPPLQGTRWQMRIPVGTPLVQLPRADTGAFALETGLD